MEIPIRIQGEVTGKLEIVPEGNYTLFRGRCADPGRLLRLSVYGGGKEGYIGVMMPEGGTVTIRKRYSRCDLRSFPETIEYAGEAGGAAGEKQTEEKTPGEAMEECKKGESGRTEENTGEMIAGEGESCPIPKAAEEKSGAAPGEERTPPGEEGTDGTEACAEECAGGREKERAEESGAEPGDGEPPGAGELIWYEVGDGTLYTRWEGRFYVAVPLSGHGLPRENMLEQRRIEGVDYAVFAAE